MEKSEVDETAQSSETKGHMVRKSESDVMPQKARVRAFAATKIARDGNYKRKWKREKERDMERGKGSEKERDGEEKLEREAEKRGKREGEKER
jgi:hypothetical protein